MDALAEILRVSLEWLQIAIALLTVVCVLTSIVLMRRRREPEAPEITRWIEEESRMHGETEDPP